MQTTSLRSNSNNNTITTSDHSGSSFVVGQYYNDSFDDEGNRIGETSHSMELSRAQLSALDQGVAAKMQPYYQTNNVNTTTVSCVIDGNLAETINGGNGDRLTSLENVGRHISFQQYQKGQQEQSTQGQYCYIFETNGERNKQDANNNNNNDENSKHQQIATITGNQQQQSVVRGIYSANDQTRANQPSIQQELLGLNQQQEHDSQLQLNTTISHDDSDIILRPMDEMSSGAHHSVIYYNQQQALDHNHELNLSHPAHQHQPHHHQSINELHTNTYCQEAGAICDYVPMSYVPFNGVSATQSTLVFQESLSSTSLTMRHQNEELERQSISYEQQAHLANKQANIQMPAYMMTGGQQSMPISCSNSSIGSTGQQMFMMHHPGNHQEISYHSLELGDHFETRGGDTNHHYGPSEQSMIGHEDQSGNSSTKENCQSNDIEYLNNNGNQTHFHFTSYQQLEASRRNYYDHNLDNHHHNHYNQLQQNQKATPTTESQESYSSAISTYLESSSSSSSSHSSSLSNCEASETESFASQLTRDEKKAREANIPLSYFEIVNLTIDQFNEQITKHGFTEAQLTLMKDIRRRGKNKVAAQTCRKRKMEQIMVLQHEVNHLKVKRKSLCHERGQLVEQHTKLIKEYDRVYSIIKQKMQPQLHQQQHQQQQQQQLGILQQ